MPVTVRNDLFCSFPAAHRLGAGFRREKAVSPAAQTGPGALRGQQDGSPAVSGLRGLRGLNHHEDSVWEGKRRESQSAGECCEGRGGVPNF